MREKLPFELEKSEPLSTFFLKELGAYEVLWSKKDMSFKKIVEMPHSPESILFDFVDETIAYEFAFAILLFYLASRICREKRYQSC